MVPGAWRTAASSLIACVSALTASAGWGAAATAAAEDSLVQPLVEVAKNREPVIVHAAQLTEAIFDLGDLFATALTLAGADERVPTDRYIDSIDQTLYLLADAGASNREFVYYWARQPVFRHPFRRVQVHDADFG